jgi:hypothetical protein
VHEPVVPSFASAAVAPVPFQAVSQHDESQDDAHRPNRRRRPASAGSDAQQPQALQLVETQIEAPVASMDDDLPRRSKPRRRRSGATENEPLQLVETQPGSEPRPDTSQTP